jgi:uncharacterized damage-inducible protein DinB
MSSLIDRLIKQLQSYHATLHASIAAVPPDLRTVTPPSGGWSVAQIIQHVAIIDGRIALMLERSIAAAPDADAAPDPDTILQSRRIQAVLDRSVKVETQDQFAPAADWSNEEGLDKLDRAHAHLLEVIRTAEGKALHDIKYPHYILGELNLWQWMAFAGTHEARHAAQIDEIAKELGCAPTV